MAISAPVAAQKAGARELVIVPMHIPVHVDGDLAEWTGIPPQLVIDRPDQVLHGAEAQWRGPDDLSARLSIAYDPNHLYLAGVVHDDHVQVGTGAPQWDRCDSLQVCLDLRSQDRETQVPGARLRVCLMPRNELRPWAVIEAEAHATSQTRTSGGSLTGFRVASKPVAGGYQFEAAIPFHQLDLQPGTRTIGFDLLLVDQDEDKSERALQMSWSGRDPLPSDARLPLVHFAGSGPMIGMVEGPPLGQRLLEDLPYVLVPLLTTALLVLLWQMWARVRPQMPWLRPAAYIAAVLCFLIGLALPGLWLDGRGGHQRQELDAVVGGLEQVVHKLEEGTLASYRGPSRDRALVDLLSGRAIARQKYTSYRFLSRLAEGEFGNAPRGYPDEYFRVRPYWLPLPKNRTESFHFDPPLHGDELYVVVGRPYAVGSLTRDADLPQLRIEQTLGRRDEVPRSEALAFDGPWAAGDVLGQDAFAMCWRRVHLHGELRSLSITAERGSDVRLVGLSLLPRAGEPAEPLFLGSTSLGGVVTDLRGAWPQDAGIELGSGAVAKVTIPPGHGEAFQKLWLFYRAVYPGVPAANPGERVAEVVLHCRGGVGNRTIVLEHQVSMFYELMVNNTRDEPPEGSPAAVALQWIDEAQERHVNMVYPVLDLPAGAELESIEFRNLADYRMRFRSVVFGTDKAAAPEDPADSPLVAQGQERRLRDDVLAALPGVAIALYRDGRLSETTLPPESRQDVQSLPRIVREHGAGERVPIDDEPAGGGRRSGSYQQLTGDGWDGAVLAVWSTDAAWSSVRETCSLIGLLLCLLATPLLLILFSELLSAVQNLRVRLMTVLAVASLVPLTVLSFLLARVLERSHETGLRDGMQAQVRSVQRQIEDQKERLRASARQWLDDLARLWKQRLGDVPPAQLEQAITEQALPELQKQMRSQLPPEWRGGHLKLELHPAPAHGAVPVPHTVTVGDERAGAGEMAPRLEPSIYIGGGALLLGVRCEEAVRGGLLSLTVGRPVNADLLQTLAPGRSVLLTDVRGYPLDAAGGSILPPEALMQHGRVPSVMAERERALNDALDSHQPVVQHAALANADWLCGADALRDLQDTPRALLLVAQPYQRATLDLAFGRISVRSFFLVAAGLILVLSAFLALVVSTRISRPIEQLERSAQAISRGELTVRVPAEEGGQIGRLTRTFNQMAKDLQARLQDLQILNRATRELAANLDFDQTLLTVRQFCEQHGAVDRVRIALLEPDGSHLELLGGAEAVRLELPPELHSLPRAGGPFSLRWHSGAGSLLAQALGGVRSVVGLPLSSGGRCGGAVLLGFQVEIPPPVNLELLATIAAQAAVALENARLYRHAVQDPTTGAFMPDFFRGRVAEEVAIAQQRGGPLALLGLWLHEATRRSTRLLRFAAVLREVLPKDAVLCHVGGGQFQALVPGADRPAAEALIGRLLETWLVAESTLPEPDREARRPNGAMVVFPDEAASAEFLFEALRDRLASGSAVEPAMLALDESLQQAGIVAVSPAMREVYRMLRRVAPTDLTILLEGETGAGKEVLTNLLHRWSKRSAGPLVKVHCAALSETLLAAELFGHEKGAFTGADRRKIGKFEQAHHGTIFLDEVGEIPLEVQVKLLRVLQEREIDRVGGTEPVPVDVRVIAATNSDIARMVAAGRFREDLYYRLQGMVVRVPPLRERKQEIPALVEHFRREIVAAGQSRVQAFSTDVMDELFRRDWPGNVRELRNAVFRTMVLAPGTQVELADLRAALPIATGAAPAEVAATPGGPPPAAAAQPAPPSAGHGGAPGRAPDQPRNGTAEALAELAGSTAAAPIEPTVVVPQPALSNGGEPDFQTVPVDQLPDRLRRLLDLIVRRGSIGTSEHMDSHGISHRTGLRDLQILVKMGLVERVGQRRGARYRPINRPSPK